MAGFARVPAFRDAVIEHDPEVLERLLERASRGCSGGAENEVCKQLYLIFKEGSSCVSRL
jgi:hypothetical protein